jgi:hypothetical protein
MNHVLVGMASSDHLYIPANFDQFVGMCVISGPKLDISRRVSDLIDVLDCVSERATSESISYKLMIAGLIASRANDWNVETRANPQAFIPTSGGRFRGLWRSYDRD